MARLELDQVEDMVSDLYKETQNSNNTLTQWEINFIKNIRDWVFVQKRVLTSKQEEKVIQLCDKHIYGEEESDSFDTAADDEAPPF